MKAITTKFHGPTNTKGSRYSASDGDGNMITVPTDFDLDGEGNHDRAAIALCNKMRWSGNLMRGATNTGNVYVFDCDSNRLRTHEDRGGNWAVPMPHV